MNIPNLVKDESPPAWLRPWLDFWFRPGDPIVLGLIRISTGLIVLYVLLATTPWLDDVYGASGWVDVATADQTRREMPWAPPPSGWEDPVVEGVPDRSPAAVQYRKDWRVDPGITSDQGQAQFSIWYHVTGPAGQMTLHLALIGVVVLFTLGLGSRVVSVIAWAGYLSYCHRNQTATFGMDTMVAILLLYSMVGPTGAALSLDRTFARRRWQKLHPGEPFPPPAPSSTATFALRLLQVHFCMIYLASGLSKLQGSAWWSGTAVWQTLSNHEFAGPPGWLGAAHLRLLADNRWLWELSMSGGVLFTLFLEISFPYLVWIRRWRWAMLLGAVMLHGGIAFSMGGLGAFSLAMLTIAASFIPPESLHWLLDRAGRALGRPGAAEAARLRRQADLVRT